MEMTRKEYLEVINTEYDETDNLNDMKADVAWALGLEVGSDDWEELMEI